MVQLSWIDEIKDRASRLIPTPYMEIVEECTAPHLLIPTYEHVKFLCETVKRKPEAIGDVVRAVRRRLADENVAVKHLTIQLLESMVKGCPMSFHVEVASQKGLLRDLVSVACMHPATGRAMQAKEAALLLTLNLSFWFRGHPAEECGIFATLADDVRYQIGPNCFEGLEPDRAVHAQVQGNFPARRQAQPERRAPSGRAPQAAPAHNTRKEKRPIVDAIPVELPTPERISAMLDACMTFSEYCNNAEATVGGLLRDDDVVASYLSQLRADHHYVTILLSSNIQLDRSVLRTVSDSQSAVIDKATRAMSSESDKAPTRTTDRPMPAQQRTEVRSASDTGLHDNAPGAISSISTAQHITPPRAEVPSGADGPQSGSAGPTMVPPLPQPPTAPPLDDLFGDLQTSSVGAAVVAAASSSGSSEHAHMASATSPTLEASLKEASDAVATASNLRIPTTAPKEDFTEAATKTGPPRGEPPVDPATPTAAPQTAGEAEPSHNTESAAVAPAASQEIFPQATSQTSQDTSAVPPPPPAAPPKDDDDFDAFLEGRMNN